MEPTPAATNPSGPQDPPTFPAGVHSWQTPPRPLSYWLRRLVACNPFYLVSAALLLLGLYLVSSDDNFPGRETAQFTLNFSALQVYEALLAATAIFLARRRIWYDSTLLVGLENLLVLVPFILLTQAAWISQAALWIVCLVAALMALARFAALKRFVADLNLPRALLLVGLVVLVLNTALALGFHHYNELKVGTKPTTGAAFELNRFSWWLLLPAVVGLFWFVPSAPARGHLPPQRRWLPAGFFVLWLAGTCVHLCSLGYVYNFDWDILFAAPALWALAWIVQLRSADFLNQPALCRSLLVLPALVTLLPAANDGPTLFALLSTLNLVAYVFIFIRQRGNWLALNLAIASVGALYAMAPMVLPAHAEASGLGWRLPLAFFTAYASYWIFRSRIAILGVFGALLAAGACGLLVGDQVPGAALPMQTGFVFLVLHSLAWRDEDDRTARAARLFGCALWLGDSVFLLLAPLPHATLILSCGAALVLAISLAARWRLGAWLKPAVPITALAVLALPPAANGVERLRSVPPGIVAVAASFLLFALGTGAALVRSRWRHVPEPEP